MTLWELWKMKRGMLLLLLQPVCDNDTVGIVEDEERHVTIIITTRV